MATKTKELLTEEKIRKHYQAEGGEWLVERGKTKEAALLKEACHELERLREEVMRLDNQRWSVLQNNQETRTEIEKPLREKINKLERSNRDYVDLLTKIGSQITWAIKV